MIINPMGGGRAEPARYKEQSIPAFRGNPWLEALPLMLSREEAKRLMARYPPYDPADRERPAEEREMLAAGLSMLLRHPLGVHVELESRLSRLIRWGYAARNPMDPTFQASVDARGNALEVVGKDENVVINARGVSGLQPAATGLTFLGTTGIGKTVGTEMTLGAYSQIIVHTEYRGRKFLMTQVVHMTLQCPKDGSIRTLCQNFFEAMDALHAPLPMQTNYQRDYLPKYPAIQRMIPSMARLAAQHGLGLLVLDEVQDLNPRGSAAILSFLVQLVNTIGVPVMLVGGVDALPVLMAQFRQARRGATEGDLIVRRAEPGQGFRAFCEILWRYQYTRHYTELTEELVQALYDGSQGITQYLVGLFKLSQIRAIATGIERLTPEIVRSVARDSFAQAGPVLRAIARGDKDVLRRMGDVDVPDGVEAIPFIRGDAKPAASPEPEVEVPEAAAAEADPTPGEPAVGAAPPAAPPPAGSSDGLALGLPLPDLVREAAARGEDPYTALKNAGVIGGPLWERIVEA